VKRLPNVPRLSCAERRTLARLRLCRMRLRRAGRLRAAGYVPPQGSDPRVVWAAAGWEPSRWRWDHDVGGYRPLPLGAKVGIERPSQMPVELVPLIDYVRAAARG
jgi:hypothetical protein